MTKVRVTSLVRMANSKSGNPQYILNTASGMVLHTKPDSTVGYVAQALEQYLLDGNPSVSTEITLDKDGMVTRLLGYGD